MPPQLKPHETELATRNASASTASEVVVYQPAPVKLLCDYGNPISGQATYSQDPSDIKGRMNKTENKYGFYRAIGKLERSGVVATVYALDVHRFIVFESTDDNVLFNRLVEEAQNIDQQKYIRTRHNCVTSCARLLHLMDNKTFPHPKRWVVPQFFDRRVKAHIGKSAVKAPRISSGGQLGSLTNLFESNRRRSTAAVTREVLEACKAAKAAKLASYQMPVAASA